MKLQDMTIAGFCAETISNSPAPGGGSVAALCGALSASLTGMVASLTLGKKGYESLDGKMQAVKEQALFLQQALIQAIDEDAASFNGYMAALKLPKDTEEQKAARKAALQQGLKEAAMVPLRTAELASEIFPMAAFVVEHGNKNALSDGLVSAMTARTAILSALLNVRINLSSIKDEAFTASMAQRCRELEKLALEQEAKILALAPELS